MPARSELRGDSIRTERLVRQRLATPLAARKGVGELIRALQPLSTGPQARPGSPPRLLHRTRFNDETALDRLRQERVLVKGRFRAGGVGYVLAEDLALYANAFQKPLERPNDTQAEVLDVVQRAGPITPKQIKAETGLLNKRIMPALHRLQTAFLVYEDQLDDDWDRPWYDFETEWPRVKLDPARREADLAEVLLRFLHAHVFATQEQIRDWTQLPVRTLQSLLSELEQAGQILVRKVDGLGEGFCRGGDDRLLDRSLPESLFVLHKGDFLVRARESELNRRFGARDILQFLLIDGDFVGAVRGHWGFKPFDVTDVALELPRAMRERRREEILAAVVAAYPPPRHQVLRYAGKRLAR